MNIMGFGDNARIILSKSELAMLEMLVNTVNDEKRYTFHQGVVNVVDEFLKKTGAVLDHE